MKLNDMDLIRSIDWLEWAQKAHEKGLTQEDIDRRAMYRVRDFGSSLSPEVMQIYQDAMVDAFDSPTPGRPEECLTSAASTVIRMATEKDWDETLAYIDGKTESWRKIWDAVRSTPKKENGCDICNKPAKWFGVFGTSYPYLRVSKVFWESGQIKSVACPFCGRDLKERVS